ncbi:MAG TPA: DUF1844 domain-containing protein [Actinomycetales bacterium]|jgi:hypothetical protein|nr:DUF1844 domain-containing protein [Actinomycetales bacterium]
MSPDTPNEADSPAGTDQATAARDIADVAAVEVITTAAVHLMSAAAVKCGLAEDAEEAGHLDLAEARILINALAGLVTSAAPDIGNQHARSLRDGLRTLQLAFREASVVPDPPGQGPGERLTGPVS